MTDVTAIKEKLRKILSRTTAAGATEAEAQSALDMALRIAQANGINLDDLRHTDTASEFQDNRRVYNLYDEHAVDNLRGLVARLVGVYPYRFTENESNRKFRGVYGKPEDVATFDSLMEILKSAAENGYKEYLEQYIGKQVTNRKSYMSGFTLRMGQRIQAMINASTIPVTDTNSDEGMELQGMEPTTYTANLPIVVKYDLVEQDFFNTSKLGRSNQVAPSIKLNITDMVSAFAGEMKADTVALRDQV